MRHEDPTFGDLRELRAQMMRWAMRLSRNSHNAEDLVQAAMVKMFANKHRFDPTQCRASTWAHVILTNVWRDQRKVAARWRTVPLDAEPLFAADDPFSATYCRQVCDFLGLDVVQLFSGRDRPMTATQRVRLLRARRQIEARAA